MKKELRKEFKKDGKKKKEITKNLLREGAEIALVVKATGLSKSEVEKLKEKLND